MNGKPWPRHCIQIIAAPTAEATIPAGEGVRVEFCGDCGVELAASERTFEIAMAAPSRLGRPLRYVCIDCGVKYDAGDLDELHDHRGGGNAVYRGRFRISRRPW